MILSYGANKMSPIAKCTEPSRVIIQEVREGSGLQHVSIPIQTQTMIKLIESERQLEDRKAHMGAEGKTRTDGLRRKHSDDPDINLRRMLGRRKKWRSKFNTFR